MRGGVGGGKTKTKKQDNIIMVEFRVATTCTLKGPIFHYKAYRQMCANSGSNIRSPQPNWSPSMMTFHQSWIYMVGKKHSGKANQLTLAISGSEHAGAIK